MPSPSTMASSTLVATMSNPSKKKGTAAESKIVKYLRDNGLDAERLALHGAKDEGDIRVWIKDCTDIRIEVKAGKQTINPSRTDMLIWEKQTTNEAYNSGCACFLIVARYRKCIRDYDVWSFNSEKWRHHMYLDEFVQMLNEWDKQGG